MLITPEQKAKIQWQCRRGMLELDLLLNPFITKHLDHLSSNQLLALEQLLNQSDPDINQWLMGYATPLQPELADIVTLIRLHHHT
jgi:antitoxin CptB